jgi:hypothetical protein
MEMPNAKQASVETIHDEYTLPIHLTFSPTFFFYYVRITLEARMLLHIKTSVSIINSKKSNLSPSRFRSIRVCFKLHLLYLTKVGGQEDILIVSILKWPGSIQSTLHQYGQNHHQEQNSCQAQT